MDPNMNLPSNSHKANMNRPSEPVKPKSVIPKGKATVPKKSFISRLCSSFMVDNVSDIGTTILNDFIIPGFRDLISDSLHNAVDLFIGGGRTYNKRYNHNRSYNNAMPKPIRSYEKQYSSHNTQNYDLNKSVYEYSELLFSDRGSASRVLDGMQDYLDEYKVVTVSAMYDLAEISTDNYQLQKFGWTDISSATIKPVKNGWLLTMPKPMQID